MYSMPMQNRQALPPGWEAKYDPTSRRWFYLNHATRSTQWTDPRLDVPQAPSRPTATSFGASVGPTETSFESTNFMEADQSKVKIVLKEYDVEETIAQSVLKTSNNNLNQARSKLAELGYVKKSVVNVDESKLDVLTREYNVPANLASSVLRTHINNLTSARNALVDMGYKKNAVAGTNLISKLKVLYPAASVGVIKEQLVLAGNNMQGAKLGLEALGYRKGESPYKSTPVKKTVAPKKNVTPKKAEPKKLTITEKLELMRKMKKKFPTLPEVSINMCLTATKYNIPVAEGILREQEEKSNKREREEKKKEPEVKRNVDLAPKVFGEDSAGNKPVETNFATSFMETMKTMDTTMKTMGATMGPSTSTMGSSAPTMGATATRTKKYVSNITKVAPQRQTYATSSKLRTKPMGPNPALCLGHNPNLLITTYVDPMGPNMMNRNGPQMSNRCGPIPSNHMGPANMVGFTRRGVTSL